MKIVAILGSPHINGNGSVALNKLLEKPISNGAICKKYSLSKLNIKNCIGCRKCVFNGGVCILQDDMYEVFQDIISADILIISSPIYICQVNGYTKTFLDRLYPLTTEHHKPRFGKRKLITLFTYGAPVPFLFRRYMKQTGKDLKAMGLQLKKTIIIKGCTTNDMVANNHRLLEKLERTSKKIFE